MSGYGPVVPIPPPLVPWAMSEQNFEQLIGRSGVRIAWAKSHTCPCTFQGLDSTGYGVEGSPREDCVTCHGLGIYWDALSTPFMGLISFGGFLPMPAEPGVAMDEKWGQVANANPLITIPYAQNPTAWAQASTFDMIVEPDSPTRFMAVLRAGVQEVLPLVNGVTVAPSGAVTTWNPATSGVATPVYTVSGNTVQIPGYPVGTQYAVEYYAAQTYVLFRRSGGLPHSRPFGGNQYTYFPRRFTAETFDLWLRQRTGTAVPPNWNGATGGEMYQVNTGTMSL